MPGQGVGGGEQRGLVTALHVNAGKRQLAGGQCPCFVERNNINRSKVFNRCAAAKENTPPRPGGNGREDPRGNGEDQRARRSDNEESHGAVKSAADFARAAEGRQAEDQPPDKKHHGARRQDDPGVGRAEAVGESL